MQFICISKCPSEWERKSSKLFYHVQGEITLLAYNNLLNEMQTKDSEMLVSTLNVQIYKH